MLKKFRKVILCLLIACMLFGCIACNNKGKQEDTGTEPDSPVQDQTPTEDENNTGDKTDGDAAPVGDKVAIKLDGAYANIIYSVDRDDTLKDATKSFAEDYAKILGVSEVSPKKAGSYSADKSEILIGNLNKYPECEEIYKTLTYDEVKVCVVGSKLVVAGYNTTLMAEVLDGLADQLKAKKDSNGNIMLDKDFVIEKNYAEPLCAVPVLAGAKPTFVDTGDDCYMINFGETEKDVFTKYCEDMVASGLTLYAEKTLEKNIYKTFVNDKYVVTAIYTGYNKFAKVLAEPLSATALATKAEDNVYTPVAGLDTTITQVGVYNGDLAETYNGMCYVIQLADGSFIVVDGGFSFEGYAERLYNVLYKQALDKDNIVIAAWMISHAHDDHVDVFESFFEAYGDKVTVERFICNMPSEEQVVNIWEPEWNRSDIVRGLLAEYFPDVPVTKAHPGQEFYIRNAKITVLYTWDLLETADSQKDFNNTSVVFKLEAEGKSVMFLGDYDDNGVTLQNLYKFPTLRCDIMQVAHHGLPENSSNGVAATIAPKYAFWPIAAQVVKNGKIDVFKESVNQYIVDHCEILMGEDNIIVFKLKDCTWTNYETLAEYIAS